MNDVSQPRDPRPRDSRPSEVAIREVAIREETIRLGQFLKLADLVDSGADAKPLLAEGAVSVNGDVDTRRGRQLVKGDVVTVGSESVRVA